MSKDADSTRSGERLHRLGDLLSGAGIELAGAVVSPVRLVSHEAHRNMSICSYVRAILGPVLRPGTQIALNPAQT
jgi:hypothetical protein